VILSGALVEIPCLIEERTPAKCPYTTAFRVSLFLVSLMYVSLFDPVARAGLQVKYPTTRFATMTSQNVTVQLVI
jgi:hypothetical protein